MKIRKCHLLIFLCLSQTSIQRRLLHSSQLLNLLSRILPRVIKLHGLFHLCFIDFWLPSIRPRALADFNPSFVRSAITSRSKWASALEQFSDWRAGVDGFFQGTQMNLLFSCSSTSVIKSFVLLPSLDSDSITVVSPSIIRSGTFISSLELIVNNMRSKSLISNTAYS